VQKLFENCFQDRKDIPETITLRRKFCKKLLRYAHLAQDHKREAIGKMARVLTNTLTNPKNEEKGLLLKAVTP